MRQEFCDGELNSNKMTRDSKTSDVNSLTATKERLEAQLKQLERALVLLYAFHITPTRSVLRPVDKTRSTGVFRT